MKKIIFAIVCMLLISFVNGGKSKEERYTYAEFKEYLKSIDAYYIIEKMEEIGIDEGEEIVIKFAAAFITYGTGFAIPTGMQFSFFTILPILWLYTENASTTIYTISGTFLYNRTHAGIAVIYPIGLWVAPRLFQQPDNIFGMGIAMIIAILPDIM